MRALVRRLAAAALAGLLACGDAAAQSGAQRHPYTHPHELRWTMAEDVAGLNGHLVSQLVVRYLATMTMAWLLRTDEHDGYVPELATAVPTRANGGISADGRTITYHLRRDAKWSDGEPFSAADVVFTTNVVLNPATNEVTRNGFDRIAKVDAPDPATVVFHLTKPYANFASTFFATTGGTPLLPEHLLKSLPDINHAEYNALPVGIGPFKYTAWHRADRIELAANPLYFRGRPKLDRITFKIITDRNTALAQLRTHEVDMWLPVPGNYLERVGGIDGVQILRRETYAFNHLDFTVTHPTVSDPAVRRALRMAYDRATIRHKIGRDLNLLSETPYGPNHPAHVTKPIPMVPFDTAAAGRALDAAGWKLGPDGIRAKNGVRLVLSVGLPSGSPDTDSQVELIRAWWKEAGVGLEVQHFADTLFFAPYQQGGIVYGGKTDVMLFAWATDGFGDLSSILGCNFIPPHGQNNTRYCNREMDALIAKQLVEYDPVKRRAYTDRIQAIIFRDTPWIVSSVREIVYAYNSDLQGFRPNSGSPFDDVINVDI
jgi:peptide/nickel transport system substrate-binding protein